MNARRQISVLLQQWREISQAEFAAIQAGDWSQLRTLQATKAAVQQGLSEARDAWNTENPTEPLSGSGNHPFAAEVSSLAALQARKIQLLEARRQKLLERQTLLRQARTNVRRLRGSYGGAMGPRWHSYS